ncbi:SpoIID/LytB domain-containing protein [Metabacillus halosaccharovorans]|uniref:SpoIID/LytB domain-containing protein n=1 Tax=Metabacillus halosaccharovorans TaxID=930124 RepID=UPI00373550B6
MKFRFLGVFFPILLMMLFLPISGKAASDNGIISVKLVNSSILGNQTTFNIDIVGNYINQGDNTKYSGNYSLRKSENRLMLYKGEKLINSYLSTFTIVPEVYGESNYISLNGKKYLGSMTFKVEGNYIRPTNTLPLEDYLKGVVPREMISSWPIEALKSQAVAARTYASSYIGKTTIDDTQSYQVYGGYDWYSKTTDAVDATSGQIITYNGRTIGGNALYYSSNGGVSLSNTNTWGTALVPYFRTGRDLYDSTSSSPHKSWNFSIYKTQINLNEVDQAKPDAWWSLVSEKDSKLMQNFKSWMFKKKDSNGNNIMNSDYEMKIVGVSNVEFFSAANLSPTATLYGDITINYILKNKKDNTFRKDSNGEISVFSYTINDESYNIRSMVGGTTMYSPYITGVGNESDRFVVHGAGFGHGIGMSQYGASKMAETHSYDQILSYYYPNTKLVVDDTLQYSPKIEFQSLEVNLPSPQKVNTPIKVTAGATGSSNLLYAFHLYDGTEWVEVQSYSSKSTYDWVPTKSGNYKFSVHVKDSYSNRTYDAYKTLDFNVYADQVDIKDVSMSKASPQLISTPIELTANATGGSKKLFAFHVYDGEAWKLAQPYSDKNNFTWVPEKAGEYKFSIHVKDYYSSNEYDDYYAFEYSIRDYVSVEDVSFSTPSPQNLGKTIRLTTNANGGINKLYKYWIYDGTSWKVLRDYQSSNSFDWTPSKAGKYRFSVHVKDENSTKEYDAYKGFEYEIKVGPVKAQSLSVDKTSPQSEGTKLTLTASATGGTNKLYKFHIYDGKTWRVLRDYQASNTVNWTPQQAGEYKLVVHVKDQTSKKEYDSYTSTFYTINKVPVDITDVKVGYESPQAVNVPITLEAQASGGVTKLYKFNVYDGKEWKDLTGYVTNPRYTWTPSKPGNYKFSVHVKDSRSKASYDDYYAFLYDVVSGPVVTEVKYPATVQLVNQPIEIQTLIKGGTKTLYRYWVLEDGEWRIVQDYSTKDVVTWIPKQPGSYKFSVHVKNEGSIKDYDSYKGFSIEVQ